MVLHFDEVHIARLVETDLIRLVQRRFRSRSTVAGVARLAIAGDRRELTGLEIKTPHDMIADFTNVERAIRPYHESVRVVNLRGSITCCSITGDRLNPQLGGRGDDSKCNERGKGPQHRSESNTAIRLLRAPHSA